MNVWYRRHTLNVMTNTQLKLFVKIAQTGSFTKAGIELNMTQPAVSRAISSLEDELGIALLIRDKGKGIMLTDIGKQILDHCHDILNSHDKIEQAIAREKGLEVGTIRVGAFPVASARFLPKIIKYISAKYPGVTLELHEGTIDELKQWLRERRIDVGFILPPAEEWHTIPLYREKMYVAVTEGHPFSKLPAVPVQMLAGEKMISCKEGYEQPILELFERGHTDLEIKYVVHNVNTALGLAQEGLGIPILSEFNVQTLPPGIVKRELSPDAYRDILIALPSLEEASHAVRLFVDTTLELFRQ